MAITGFTKGSANAKKRSFIIWMRDSATLSTEDVALLTEDEFSTCSLGDTLEKAFLLITTAAGFLEFKSLMTEVGSFLKASIDDNYASDEKVELNDVGEIAVSSKGTFAGEIVEVTAANIAIMRGVDGTSLDIMLESDAEDFNFLHSNIAYSYEEKYTGGEVTSLPINMSKTVNTIGDWSAIVATPAA